VECEPHLQAEIAPKTVDDPRKAIRKRVFSQHKVVGEALFLASRGLKPGDPSGQATRYKSLGK
jgi:hypothetical protein